MGIHCGARYPVPPRTGGWSDARSPAAGGAPRATVTHLNRRAGPLKDAIERCREHFRMIEGGPDDIAGALPTAALPPPEATEPPKVWEWFDFVCPFCYVGQDRSELLRRGGFAVVELPFRSHPQLPVEGISAGPRDSPLYRGLELEAKSVGLPLRWPSRIPRSETALATVEWARRRQPSTFRTLFDAFFRAHFVLGEDIGDVQVVRRYAEGAGLDFDAIYLEIRQGWEPDLIRRSEDRARSIGVPGTPSWLIGNQLLIGLQPRSAFERIVTASKK